MKSRRAGQTATEYMLIISVIVIAVVAAAYLFVPQFQSGVIALASDVSTALATGQVGGIGFARNGAGSSGLASNSSGTSGAGNASFGGTRISSPQIGGANSLQSPSNSSAMGPAVSLGSPAANTSSNSGSGNGPVVSAHILHQGHGVPLTGTSTGNSGP